MRPQRGSREMSSIGAKVQLTPAAAASSAATLAPSRTTSGFQVAAWPSGMRITVLKPWMTSRPFNRGMPSRLSSTAMRCRSFTSAGSTWLITAPMRPRRMASRSASSSAGPSAWTWFICPIFSSSVMRPSRSATRPSTVAGEALAAGATLGIDTAMATSTPQADSFIAHLVTLVVTAGRAQEVAMDASANPVLRPPEG